jgi:putative MATE family efflux protein
MLVTMVFQTLYFLVDLYWVGRLGTDAIAAVSIAGNLTFIVLGLTQMLGVGTTTVVSHAVGRKEHDKALLLFNQSQVLALITGFMFLIVGMAVRTWYCRAMSADPKTAELAGQYLMWFIPAMALQFALVAMGSALRGIGIFKPGMLVSTTTVIINMVLAPFLIFGWVTHRPFGVAGAAMSSLIAIVVGIVWFSTYFIRKDAYLRLVVADWGPRLAIWRRVLGIGLPAGFEFAITALCLVIVDSIMRPFGASAQAGYGIGSRVVQAGFMPVVALGFAVAPVAGQNFGAGKPQRVKDTFRDGALMAAGAMLLLAVICNVAPEAFIKAFSKDPAVIEVAATYLRIVSWNFVASGLIFVASSMFQAMGNTIPSLITSGFRILLFAIPAYVMSKQPGFHLNWMWYLAVGSVWIQLALSMLLLRREYNKRLQFSEEAALAA